ncbi:MAG: GNAT family N-acetyltransferase [Candidatus Eisenbacteria bacterium]|nr:GNAT family N-acetyltransferase [Candidatus Eisenbacteria bacterium]
MTQDPSRRFAAFRERRRKGGTRRLDPRLRIRIPEVADAEAIARISSEREGGDPTARLPDIRWGIRRDRRSRGALVLVAEIAGTTVGFGRLRYVPHIPPRARAGYAPGGWYLTGVIVDPDFRRRGVAHILTRDRLRWIASRSRHAYYVANARNRASIALHEAFGFVEMTPGPELAGIAFCGGEGVLFRADLTQTTLGT